jgi:hypothetical protein
MHMFNLLNFNIAMINTLCFFDWFKIELFAFMQVKMIVFLLIIGLSAILKLLFIHYLRLN